MDVVAEVRIEPGGEGTNVVVLTGEHDLGTVPRVRDALEQSAADGRTTIVDLSGADFIDSSILGAILDARREALEADRGFAVTCDGSVEPVRRVLEITGLAAELPVHPTRDEALAALGPGGGA